MYQPSIGLCLICLVGLTAYAHAEVRVKDITTIEGDRPNQLSGMGLVTGLKGTGGTTPLTRELALNMFQRFGVRADPALRQAVRNDTKQKTDNISAVMVTAEITSTDKPGERIEVNVSALDDATSLEGGELIFTPLAGVDGEVYAVAWGRVIVGGFSASGDAASVQKNHTTSGLAFARVEKAVPRGPTDCESLRLLLRNADYGTATRIAEAINAIASDAAQTPDAGTIHVTIPAAYRHKPAYFMDAIQQLRITPDTRARVVINDRTGTVVIGDNVRLSRVAIAHGNLAIITGETPEVSQPEPFSQGKTALLPRTAIEVVEERKPITVLDEPATVGDLAQALNALGVTPRDLGSIFRMLQAEGSLHAELVFK